MTSVFLSYDHDDAAKARSIAIALEKAGHSVWWDLDVRGGAQFSKVIEEALKAAEVVVVLWSIQSVESPWVRDEAATGRDRGRLVPVSLDQTELPLGFRQFQTISLGNWKGRGTVPRLADILHAIDGAWGEDGERLLASPVKTNMPAFPDLSRSVRLGLLAFVFFAAIGLAYFIVNRDVRSDVHTIAITAADPAANAIARDLVNDLGNVPSVQTGAVQLLGDAGQAPPELIFEVQASGPKGSSNLALLDGKDRAILWSQEFGGKSDTPADTKLRMTYTAGRVLGCAVEGLEPEGKALRVQTLKLYLTGCSQFAEASYETWPSVIPVFEQVVRDAPRFEAGWAKLLLAESDAVSADPSRDRASLRQYIAQARKLDPQMPEATLAEVALLPARAFGEALRLLDRTKEAHPGNAVVIGYRSLALANVGRMNEAVEEAKEAARLDPTSLDALSHYVLILAYSGRVDAATAELQRAERLWSGTGKLQELQDAFQLRFGDPKEMVKSETFKEANPRMQLYYRTRADPTPANIDRFMAFLRDLYRRRGLTADNIVGHAQAYGEVYREDDLYDLIFRLPASEDLSNLSGVIFRPSLRKFRHDPRFMTVAKRIGLVDYWTKSGIWPDFCFDPDQPYDCKAEAGKLR
jgi:tetratricopeptide (TPR) repeat protein